ncbi:hypothetical protein ONS95_013508 [Cadophora gregata]|uniref:uncharacterized protein n=1 Tax=Cadophora gregata TaxID=51156 RepID=UPI0026DBB62E|nr:uncharacterized protein ONS95_013508 [Cadophora gregata]KAK0099595.1 hypothetical protein ONS96_008095 [Cadophora gregata f. sp. sojae]KAK0116496.1 hypothetical protein ONS95_013508 [Cadophora gregata]
MAEIFGLVAAAAGVLDTLSKVISLIDSIRRAPQEARDVANEVESLRAVIEVLRLSAERPSHSLPPEWIQTTSTVLINANAASRRLESSIRTGTSKMFLRTRLKWVLRSSETNQYCVQLRSYAQMLNTLQGSIHWQSSQRMEAMLRQILSLLRDGQGLPPYTEATGPISTPAPARPVSPEIKSSVSPVYRYTTPDSPAATDSESDNDNSNDGDESDSSDSGESWDFTSGDVDGATIGSGKLTVVEDAENRRVLLKIKGTDTTTLKYWLTSRTQVANSSGDLEISYLSDGKDLPLEDGLADLYSYSGAQVRMSMYRSGKVYPIQRKCDCFRGRAMLITMP